MNKNYNDTKTILNEMYNLLGGPRKLTLEGLVSGADDDMDMPQEMQGMSQDEMGGEAKAMGQMPQGGNGQQQPAEENPLDGDPEITSLITNIRVQTLQGLTKLAEHPETAQYELLKKIFLLVDKSVEDKLDPEKQ